MLERRRTRLLHDGARRSLSPAGTALRQREIRRIAAALAPAIDFQAEIDAVRLRQVHNGRTVQLTSRQTQLAALRAVLYEQGGMVRVQDLPAA